MPEQMAVFVAAIIAHSGERAYSFALEQVSLAAGAGSKDVAMSWATIADDIGAMPRTAYLQPVAVEGIELPALQQLVYTSTAHQHCDEDALAAILRSSRDNNVLYSVTGILWSDGERFIQVLEGPAESVHETYDRIITDERHHGMVVVHDQLAGRRDFGKLVNASPSLL